MKKCKYRVWDTIDKKFISAHLITINGNGRISFAFGHSSGGDGFNGERFIVQHCTGCLTHDGKEIYEGDIVQKYFNSGGTHGFSAFEVKWSDQHFGFCISTGKSHYYEIIGNIFQTPNLLK